MRQWKILLHAQCIVARKYLKVSCFWISVVDNCCVPALLFSSPSQLFSCSFSAGVNCCIPALLISSPTQLFSVSQQDLLLYSSTVNFQLHTAVLRLLARNKYYFPILTCIFSCILFFPHFLINEPIFSGHFYITMCYLPSFSVFPFHLQTQVAVMKKQIKTNLSHFLKQEVTRLNNKCRNLDILRLKLWFKNKKMTPLQKKIVPLSLIPSCHSPIFFSLFFTSNL